MTNTCIFCSLPSARIVLENEVGFVIYDGFPVSPGHTLVIPKRHIGSVFDLSMAESAGLATLAKKIKEILVETYQPDGYNIGINDGPAAGQTVPHLHIHIIPRYDGDVADPRGGVRWVVPDKANYWRD